jgi:DNA-binding transcriptional ArsR family regulator
MPFEADEDQARRVQIDVRPSAVLELTWVLCMLEWDRYDHVEGLRDQAPSLLEEIADAVGDVHGGLPDVSILAERIGALLTDEADTFLHGLEGAAQLDGAGLELRSESPDVREATLARLERLRDEPVRAARYGAVLTRVWEAVRPEWERTGRPAVLRACADWSARLRQGAGLTELLSGRHIARRADQERLLGRRRRIVLTPMYFCGVGGSIVDMTGYVHIGGPLRPSEAHELRKDSELIAARLKVLADGTRVALLRQLVQEPASVMDLARRFGLAQPTVSNHVRLLRDARLLESTRDGARTVYRVPRDQLGRLLEETRDLLLEL